MSHISLTYHIIWRTKCSERTISESHERELYSFILSLCEAKKCQLLRINSMPDHIHMCVSLHPAISLSEFVKVIKQESSRWLKDHHDLFPYFDAWANGYAAFTYSANDRPIVIEYIKNQKLHHQHTDLRAEYENLLREFGIDPSTDLFLKD